VKPFQKPECSFISKATTLGGFSKNEDGSMLRETRPDCLSNKKIIVASLGCIALDLLTPERVKVI